MMKQLFCLSLVLLPLLVVVSEATTILGRWEKIKDLSDPTVVEMAKFAIAEHNKQAKADLVYEKVVKGWKGMAAGYGYDLFIAAKNGTSKTYEAVVFYKPWLHSKTLYSFKALPE